MESYELFKTNKEENAEYYFVIRSTWNKTKDYNKLDISMLELKIRYNKVNIEPTIKRDRIYIEKEIAEDMLLQFNNIKISPIPDIKSCGCDGSSYELRVNTLFHNCHFRWWEEGPENWNELITYTMEIIKYF